MIVRARARPVQIRSPGDRGVGFGAFGGDHPARGLVRGHLAGGIDVVGVGSRIGEARASAGGTHHVRNECGGPSIGCVLAGGEDEAVGVVLAGVGGVVVAGVEAEPPVFADALPEAGLAFGLVVRERGGAGIRRVVVDRGAEEAPFALRDGDFGGAREGFVGQAGEKGGRERRGRWWLGAARGRRSRRGGRGAGRRGSSVAREGAVFEAAEQTDGGPEEDEIERGGGDDRARIVGDALRLARLEQQFGQRHDAGDGGEFDDSSVLERRSGMTLRTAWGSTTWRSVWSRVKPEQRAASGLAGGMLSMPARRTSP